MLKDRTHRASSSTPASRLSSGDSEPREHVRQGLLSKVDPDTNRLVTSIELGFRPEGVVVADGLVWVAVAPN